MVLNWPVAANPFRQGKSTVRSNWLPRVYIQKGEDSQGKCSESALTKRDLGINPAFEPQLPINIFQFPIFNPFWAFHSRRLFHPVKHPLILDDRHRCMPGATPKRVGPRSMSS
jgi:hypothetical protein